MTSRLPECDFVDVPVSQSHVHAQVPVVQPAAQLIVVCQWNVRPVGYASKRDGPAPGGTSVTTQRWIGVVVVPENEMAPVPPAALTGDAGVAVKSHGVGAGVGGGVGDGVAVGLGLAVGCGPSLAVAFGAGVRVGVGADARVGLGVDAGELAGGAEALGASLGAALGAADGAALGAADGASLPDGATLGSTWTAVGASLPDGLLGPPTPGDAATRVQPPARAAAMPIAISARRMLALPAWLRVDRLRHRPRRGARVGAG